MDNFRKKIRLGDLLVSKGIITQAQLERALELQKGTGRKLGETLVEEAIVNDEVLAKALADQLGVDMVDPQNMTIPDDILNLVQPNVLKKNKLIPFEYAPDNPNVIRVAMADPLDLAALDDISIITNLQVEPAIATQRSIMLALDKLFGQAEVDTALEQYAKEREAKDTTEEDLLNENINSSPIVTLVNEMIEKAVRQRASDIHVEPMERQVRIRYRIDGA